MPTGYTSLISDGVEFKDFALICSRAFGALVSMRDEPMGAPLPEKFEASTYNLDQKIKAQNELNRFSSLSDEEIIQMIDLEWIESMDRWKKSKRNSEVLKAKYESMLQKVRDWTPPTPEHKGLKTFMIEQIESSIKFDCVFESKRPEKQTFNDFKISRLKSLMRDLEYHTKQHADELKRTSERNKWLSDLRDSLK